MMNQFSFEIGDDIETAGIVSNLESVCQTKQSLLPGWVNILVT